MNMNTNALSSHMEKFLFDGAPVRGACIRLTAPWQEILQRRAANTHSGAYPAPVARLLGEMTAAACLMQANIKFNGALLLQMQGTGAVKMAVAEVHSSLALRATASVQGMVAEQASLADMFSVANGQARCAITLDPQDRLPGQQPYQGVVPLQDASGQPFTSVAKALEHYMKQSEQLDTTLVLAADTHTAAGLLIQRLPTQGTGNLAGDSSHACSDEQAQEHYQRIATLAASLTQQELLSLDTDTILHRLFWQENLLRFAPSTHNAVPHFACTCSRERVSRMVAGLGQDEAHSIVAEQGQIEVGCEFCGQQYRFDALEVTQLFTPAIQQAPGSNSRH